MPQSSDMPTESIQWGKLAAEFVVANGKIIFDAAVESGNRLNAKVKSRLKDSYTSYLVRLNERYGKARTFFLRDHLVPLYKYYIPLAGKHRDEYIETIDGEAVEAISNRVVIHGQAGCGKSTLMRHLALNEIIRKKRVPVIVELRNLNDDSPNDASIMEYIEQSLSDIDKTKSKAFVESAFELGMFTILLDGFDELKSDRRKVIVNEILSLTERFNKNNWRIASRPDPCFSGWNTFEVIEAQPLDLKKSCALVEKLPADEEIKSKFISELKKKLFEQHSSFLSNPLLLTIMLLTYGQSADIPTRLSVFYEQAYSALFQGHDALKGGFRRNRRTSLDIHDFARVFASFSVLTYDQAVYQLAESEATRLVREAGTVSGISTDADGFLDDCLQSVCLLLRDGLNIQFSHRSFQEYFAAKFIASQPKKVQSQLVRKYTDRFVQDNTLQLLHELHPAIVEECIFEPHLRKLETICAVKRRVGITHWLRYVKSTFTCFTVDPRGYTVAAVRGADRGEVAPWIDGFIAKNYSDYWDGQSKPVSEELLRKSAQRSTYGKTDSDDCILIKTRNMTTRDPFSQALSKSHCAFGLDYVEMLVAARQKIESSRSDLEKSVRDLLSLN